MCTVHLAVISTRLENMSTRNQSFAHVPHKWKFQKQIFETTTCHGNSMFLHVYSGNCLPILSHLYFNPSVKPSIHLPSFSPKKSPTGLMVYKSRSHRRKNPCGKPCCLNPFFSRWIIKWRKVAMLAELKNHWITSFCICTGIRKTRLRQHLSCWVC